MYVQEMNEYINILFNTKEGDIGKQYLRSRNISPATAKYWNIGYCPKNFVPNCYRNQQHKIKFWEKMQGRITIPVLNQYGDVISISGRSVFPEIKPKYYHYQMPIRKTLLGLYQNKEHIFNDNCAFLVEGQIDIITAWQAGFKNCVCTFGSHFSDDQISILLRYTNNIGILFDNDDAGQIGANSGLKKINNTDDNVMIRTFFPMKPGQDVDDWIKNNNSNWQMLKDWFKQYGKNGDN